MTVAKRTTLPVFSGTPEPLEAWSSRLAGSARCTRFPCPAWMQGDKVPFLGSFSKTRGCFQVMNFPSV